MKTLNLLCLTALALTFTACGGENDGESSEESSETSSASPVKEEKVTFTQWNDSTKIMDDMSWTVKYQYAEIRMGLIYVIMSDVDLGEDYLMNRPGKSKVLQLTTMLKSVEGTQEGTYPTDVTGAGNVSPYINGKQLFLCCGRNGNTTTSGTLKITRVTKELIEGEAEQFGFDSTYIKVKFSAPLMAVDGQKPQ